LSKIIISSYFTYERAALR